MVISAVEAFREEGRIEGRIEGLEKGRVEGLEKSRHEIAENLLQKGMGLEDVVEVTRLSQQQVRSIRQKLNNTSGD